MCHLRNIAMCDYQISVTTGQTDARTHTHTDERMDRQKLDKVIPMCCYASQGTQKVHQVPQNLPQAFCFDDIRRHDSIEAGK